MGYLAPRGKPATYKQDTSMPAYIALLFLPATTAEEMHAAVDEHFSRPNAGATGHRQTVVMADPALGTVAGSLPTALAGAISAATTPPAQSAPAAAESSVQLDRDGLPHDNRIHSSSKELNQDGSWRKKRGVSDALVSSVTAELRKVMAAGGVQPQAPAMAGNTPIPASTLAQMNTGEQPPLSPEQVAFLQSQKATLPGNVPALGPVSAAAPTPAGLPPIPGAAPALPALGPTPEQLAYQSLVQLITSNLVTAGGRLTEEWCSQVIAHFGVVGSDNKGSLALLVNRPDVVAQVSQYIAQALAG